MTIESVTYIGDFDLTLPRSGDKIEEGDDHIRDVIKKGVVQTFPGKDGKGFNKAIIATEDEINYLSGVTSPLQDQFLKYMPLAGDSEKTGELVVKAKIETKGENAEGLGGLSMKNSIGAIKGGFDWNSVDNHLQIQQVGPLDGSVDTRVEIYAGNMEMVAGPGFDTTPTLDNHLATKKYVDDSGAGPGGATEAWVTDNFIADTGDQFLNGTLTVVDGIRANSTGAGDFGGYVVNFSGVDRLALGFNESNGVVTLIQRDGFDSETTKLSLDAGVGYINDLPITTAATVQSQLTGASGTFEDNNGNIVTVTNGLITSLS